MVRFLGVLLVVTLLLCGCAKETTDPTDYPTQPTDSALQTLPGLYVPDSAMEQATNGAVRAFQLGSRNYYGCAMMGEDLVLVYQENEAGAFALCRGEDLKEIRTISLGEGVVPTMEQMQISSRGIGYFDSKNKDMVFLNADFLEIGRMHLPEELKGNVWLSPNWQMVYYCTDKGIHAMDLQSGISRLLREQNAISQDIIYGLADGECLLYSVEIAEGEKRLWLIDANTGALLQDGEQLNDLRSSGQQYFLPQTIKDVLHLRFGRGEDHQVLWPVEENAEPETLFANNAVVMVQNEEAGISLAYYDLATGKRLSAVTLDGITEIWSMQGDGGKGVWLFGCDNAGKQQLYHWDCTKNPSNDETDYTAPLYSREQPDEAGLAEISQSAAELGDKFGVDILIWKDAVAAAPADQFFTEEYMTQLYELYLPRLEQALSMFPQEIFTKPSMGRLQIALVQHIAGEPAWGTLAEAEYIQFWNGDVPVIALTLGENFERNLYHGVYLYMETQILSNSSKLYEWYKLNPSGFEYDNNYITNLDRTDTTFISAPKPYFIDLFSMSYAKEDRATIFEYACMPGNEEYFGQTVLKEKLRRICKGIREAYGLKNVETQFPWEQYVTG